MEFAEIKPPVFGVDKPPAAYPSHTQDRDGNYTNTDKDFSQSSQWSSEEVSNFHSRADTDSSTKSIHHTLGTGRHNASSGNHIHDGTTSKKLGTGMGLVLTGSKGGNVALTNLINMLKNFVEFTDSTT